MGIRFLVSAIVTLGACAAPARAQLPEFPFVFSEGNATAEVPPDRATVSFEIVTFAGDSSEAFATAEGRTADVLELCAGLEMAQADVVAYELEKEELRDESGTGQELAILGYEFRREIHVTVRDLARYPAFVGSLVSMDNVTAPESRFESSRRQEIEAQLIGEACSDARREAELMAAGAGVELGSVFAISPIELRDVGARFVARVWGGPGFGRGAQATPLVLFVPSTITISKAVHVMYRIDG